MTDLAPEKLSANGQPPTRLPEPNKQTRSQVLDGFAGEGNLGEARAAARRTRSPTETGIMDLDSDTEGRTVGGRVICSFLPCLID